MVKPTLPVDIYIRVSRVGKRGEKLISPDEQEHRARALAQERGLVVGTVLPFDLDESGGKLDRPGLNEALRRVEAKESGGIIVAWLDRLSRDSEHAAGLLRRIDEAGGAIYAPDAPSDMTTAEGELQVTIMFGFAQYMRRRAAKGFDRAKEQAIARGIPVNTRPAVGYRKRDGEGEDRRLEPDPGVAPIVREVFERRAAGDGPAVLAELLEQHGVCTHGGRGTGGSSHWTKQAVYGLLSNRVYLGELRWGPYVNEDAHAAIVDLATWTAAQHPTTRKPSTSRPKNARYEYLLTGLVRCAGCRYALQATTTSHGKRIYRCTRKHAGGTCTSPARVSADQLEPVIVNEFWRFVGDLEAQGHTDAGLDDLSPLETSLERAERLLEQLSSPEAQDALGDSYLTVFSERRKSRDQAAQALGEARATATAQASPLPDVQTLRASWERWGVMDRRELLAAQFDLIALHRDPARAVLYPAGTGPADLPRRGFQTAEFRSLDPPAGARMVAL